jgi:cysteine-rich repeat protein
MLALLASAGCSSTGGADDESDGAAERECGNGVLELGEECDDAAPGSKDACDDACRLVETVAAGHRCTCVRRPGDALQCWGSQVPVRCTGTGWSQNIGDDETPAEVGDLALGFDVEKVSVGAHVCAIDPAGIVRCWGGGEFPYTGVELGLGREIFPPPAAADAEPVKLPDAATSIDVGESYTCAALASGE